MGNLTAVSDLMLSDSERVSLLPIGSLSICIEEFLHFPSAFLIFKKLLLIIRPAVY